MIAGRPLDGTAAPAGGAPARALALPRVRAEYLIEGVLLGLFMIAACAVTIVLEHPDAALRSAIGAPAARRALIGAAMGLTAMALIYSPWGRRSGAHMNPALTLAFLRLGKLAPGDAAAYVAAQFAGGAAGVALIGGLAAMHAGHPDVRFAATLPGAHGAAVAFAAELAISFLMMTMVLLTANSARLAPYTGVCAGLLVAVYITVEAPLSGMSMNPARTVASALAAGEWRDVWVYLLAPPLGMLAAAELYARRRGLARVFCAKLRHDRRPTCIFRCNYDALGEGG